MPSRAALSLDRYEHLLPTPDRLLHACIIAGLVGLVCPRAADGVPVSTRVTIESGTVQGQVLDGVLSFKGIPYAAPPVGELRWRPPQRAEPWTNIREARSFGSDCMQRISDPANLGIPALRSQPNEDCLYLNLWRPVEHTGRLLPVMAWIYGGGFNEGGSSAALYEGQSFAQRAVLLVSFNYRLGRFGFFGHPALTHEWPNEPKANYGFLDQIAALAWIRRNIAAFGGDPENVTVFGESAGGVSVDALLVSPLARGLFKKAIIESGSSHILTRRVLSEDRPGRRSLEAFGLAFARSLGIVGEDAEALKRLRALPAQFLLDLKSGLPEGIDETRVPWGGPSMDGRVLPIVEGDYFRLGQFAKVPLLIGANSDDVTTSTGAFEDHPIEETLSRFGDRSDAALRAYDPDRTGDAKMVRHRVAADGHMIEPARFVGRAVAASGAPVYRYYFSYVTESRRDRWIYGSPHGSEIAYVFGTLNSVNGPATSDRDEKVSRTLNTYWTNFAKHGDPNGDGLPFWPQYNATSEVIMQFSADPIASATRDPLEKRLDFAAAVAQPDR